MKLSVIKNTGKGGGLTLPLGDEQGSYIAKFPSTSFPGVSENEYANLALAEAIGMDVPERELVEQSEFEGIPEEFKTLSDGKVLLVKRFDRGAQRRADPYRGFRSGVWRLSFAQIRRSRLSRYRCGSWHRRFV
jgi:serine/threonine-protein kinase HipA